VGTLVLLLLSQSVVSASQPPSAKVQAAPASRQSSGGLVELLKGRRAKSSASAAKAAATHGTMSIDGSETSEVMPQHLQLTKKNEQAVGRADDFSWVTGQLFRLHTSQGDMWVLRYATLDSEDIFGGSVILAPSVEMKNYRDGDVICVHGGILDPNRNPRLGGALYRPDTISMVERVD